MLRSRKEHDYLKLGRMTEAELGMVLSKVGCAKCHLSTIVTILCISLRICVTISCISIRILCQSMYIMAQVSFSWCFIKLCCHSWYQTRSWNLI